jgi:hypothetical protein
VAFLPLPPFGMSYPFIRVLVQISFMSLLFDYRKVFHSIAAQAVPPGTAASTVICWVDVILATLSEATIKVARGLGHCQDNNQNSISEILRKQSEDNNMRAAAQLPRM